MNIDVDPTPINTHNPLPFADICDSVRPDAASSENALYRTRTYDPLIKSQLLCQLS